MDSSKAIIMLAALAQDTRLNAFRALIRFGPDGVAAGLLADELGVPQNTLSTHLAILAQAELVVSQRQGRSIIYQANLESVRAIVLYLLKDCCGGRAELCAPLVTELSNCCTNERPRKRR